METLKKIAYGVKKTKIIVVRTGKEEVERVNERVHQGTVMDTDSYKYPGIV